MGNQKWNPGRRRNKGKNAPPADPRWPSQNAPSSGKGKPVSSSAHASGDREKPFRALKAEAKGGGGRSRPWNRGASDTPAPPDMDAVLVETLGSEKILKQWADYSKEWILKLASGTPLEEFEAECSKVLLGISAPQAPGGALVSPKHIPPLVPSKSYKTQKSPPKTHASEAGLVAPLESVGATPVEVVADRGYRSKSKTVSSGAAVSQQATLAPQGKTEPNSGSFTTSGGILLDAWQKNAVDALLNGHNCIVDAPTSAGKTRVIEAWIEARGFKNLRLIYTSPVKSLSNDKYREFSEKYGKEYVGINTGDFKENLGAPIVLATLETYRNSLLGVEPNMNTAMVVYDEYHYLQDESRGSAWEESMILTPRSSQFLLLSASVPNTADFAQWLEALFEKPCTVVKVAKRPVPLFDIVYTREGFVIPALMAFSPAQLEKLRLGAQAIDRYKSRSFRKPADVDLALGPVTTALELGLGPMIVYAGRRGDTEKLAQVLHKRVQQKLESEDISTMAKELTNLSGYEYVPSDLQKMVARTLTAYHHSGMIPPGRVAIETLLKNGSLKVCTGTMGISLGVNFAVRSALVFDESRPSEGGETRYSQTEVMQMLGRAGRRGKDAQGFSLWLDYGRYLKMKPTSREACESSLRFDPSTVLGILGQHESFAYLSHFYSKSFLLRGKGNTSVALLDNDVLSAQVYKLTSLTQIPCHDIPSEHSAFHKGNKRTTILCHTCPGKKICHDLVGQAKNSPLQRIVTHLKNIGALTGASPSRFGQLARHFPQSGGMIVAHWISTGQFSAGNFWNFLPVLGVFCSAHHKEMGEEFAPWDAINSLQIPRLIEGFYPEDLFPDLYDKLLPRRRNQDSDVTTVFREFNPAASSVIKAWMVDRLDWESLVEKHESKYFSAGDCMMTLFRFNTFLQSCIRLYEFDSDFARMAKQAQITLLREPMDARNKMLLEDDNDTAVPVEPLEALPEPPKV